MFYLLHVDASDRGNCDKWKPSDVGPQTSVAACFSRASELGIFKSGGVFVLRHTHFRKESGVTVGHTVGLMFLEPLPLLSGR
jgi:hypothetical protein